MDKNQGEHPRKRTIKNIVNNQTVEQLPNEGDEQNPNFGNEPDVEIPNNNNQENPTIKDNPNSPNNIEPYMTTDMPPPLSNEPIIQDPNQIQDPQANNIPYFSSENPNQILIPSSTINNNPNINATNNQYQQIGYQNPILTPNQMYPQKQIIIIQRVPVVPFMQYTNTCSSIRLTCPYCNIIVNTVPYSEWTCNSCCRCIELSSLYYFTACIGLFCHLCCLWCSREDFCCEEADHRCPNCKNVIARRKVSK